MTRCLMCKERFAICAVTYEVDGGEICDGCDATFAEPIRPSLGGAVAFLNRERREPDPDPELLHSPQSLPLAVRMASPLWAAGVAVRHPHKAERRSGPRASRFDNLPELTR